MTDTALTYYKRKLLNEVVSPPLLAGNGDSLDNDLILSDEVQSLVLQVTANEYTQILSALLNGAYTTYPENYQQVIYPLLKAGKMSFCDEMLWCIENNGQIANAILSLTRDYLDSREFAQSFNDTDLAESSNPTCDYDILWGQCLQLVQYLDQINRDVLEVIEVAFNGYESAAEILGDITGIDESSLDAVFTWIVRIQDNIAENYDAQITQAYIESVACEIFCKAKLNNCRIEPDTLWTVFADRLSATVTIESLLVNSLNYLVQGQWVGTEIADFMFFSQLAFRSQLGKYLTIIGYQDLNQRLIIYGNDPSSDWTVICDCSQTLTINYDGLIAGTKTWTQGGITIEIFDDTFFTSVDFTGQVIDTDGNPLPSQSGTFGLTQTGNNGRGAYIKITFPSAVTIDTASWDYNFNRATGQAIRRTIYCDGAIGWTELSNETLNVWLNDSNAINLTATEVIVTGGFNTAGATLANTKMLLDNIVIGYTP